ncbi:ribosome silencing factor [Desulfonatronovibrio magnus]|uniref:ribosome silencing factor n=1 Tax=Desulfonatronovibrio magnus TaxID=698827 RepID=UPI0005EBB8B5|nr:ribosome silencing factor [Desulfonatronovibrio magnus]
MNDKPESLKKVNIILNNKLKMLGGLLSDKKARDILLFNVSNYSSVFEGIIVATAHGNRHCRALADHLLDEIKKQNLEYLGMEGYQEGEWILLDLNEIIIHLFTEETRLFYNLEGFWTKGSKIELTETPGTNS